MYTRHSRLSGLDADGSGIILDIINARRGREGHGLFEDVKQDDCTIGVCTRDYMNEACRLDMASCLGVVEEVNCLDTGWLTRKHSTGSWKGQITPEVVATGIMRA